MTESSAAAPVGETAQHAEPVPAPAPSVPQSSAEQAQPSSSKPARPPKQPPPPPEPTQTLMERRVTVIQEGDQVMLQLPSDAIKTVSVNAKGQISLGKFGSFPSRELIGKHYGVTYEIVAPSGTAVASASTSREGSEAPAAESSGGKKGKGKGKAKGGNPNGASADGNVLLPIRKARMEELEETSATNDLIDDIPAAATQLLPAEEIIALREAGLSAEEIMQRQIERHENFALKTEFSKDKWKKRKEKKFSATVTPLPPVPAHILTNYHLRGNPAAVLSLRLDTLSQMLSLASIRPGGRYLVVEDTGGLIVGALLDRMGGEGRIMQINDADSPPPTAILDSMNFPKHIVESVCASLNWYQADEDYEPVPEEAPVPKGTPINPQKEAQKNRRRNAQNAALNRVREELHRGEWDGLVMASAELSPPSVIARLTPYLGGSANIVVYSQWLAIMTETLQGMRERYEYLAPNLTESWTRLYQVLPGRTHPMMMTSGTGGYLLHAIRVHPNLDLGASKARIQRGKRSAPGEGVRAQRKKAKLLKAAEEGASSPSAIADADSGREDPEDEAAGEGEGGDVPMAEVLNEEEEEAAGL